MKSESESLDPSEACDARAAEGNCVDVRRGGEQPDAETQSATAVSTVVNPFRPAIPTSLLVKGEVCGGFGAVRLLRSHPTLKGEGRGVEGGWGWNESKASWLRIESCAGGRRRPLRSSQSVHSSVEAGNDRGAKGRRKVKTQ